MDFIHKYIPSSGADSDTTFVLLHGTGGNEEDLIPFGQFLAPGAAYLGIRGKVMEGGAARFFRRLAEGVFDEQDLRFRTQELTEFLAQATVAYALNPQKLVAVGYSNGANIAASIMLLKPDTFSAAVLLRAMVPLEPETLPQLNGKPVLMQSGRQDPIIPVRNSERLARMLGDSGADVTFHLLAAGHALTNAEFATAKSWVQENACQ